MDSIEAVSIPLSAMLSPEQQMAYLTGFAKEFGIPEPRITETGGGSGRYNIQGKTKGTLEERLLAMVSFPSNLGAAFCAITAVFSPPFWAQICLACGKGQPIKRQMAERMEGLLGPIMIDALHSGAGNAGYLLGGFFEQAPGLFPGAIASGAIKSGALSDGETQVESKPGEPKTHSAIFWLPRDSKLHLDREWQRKAIEAFVTEFKSTYPKFTYNDKMGWWDVRGVSITSQAGAIFGAVFFIDHISFKLEFDPDARQKYPRAEIFASSSISSFREWHADVEKRIRVFFTAYCRQFGPDRTTVFIPTPSNWNGNPAPIVAEALRDWAQQIFRTGSDNYLNWGKDDILSKEHPAYYVRSVISEEPLFQFTESNGRMAFTFFNQFLRSAPTKLTKEAALQRKMESLVEQALSRPQAQTPNGQPAASRQSATGSPPCSLADLTHRTAEEQARLRWAQRHQQSLNHSRQPPRKIPR